MNKRIYEYLSGYISKRRIGLFEKVIVNRTRHITVVLEDVFQPHNISAVLRSCDCFGIQDVHIIENRNKYEPYRKATAGAEKWLNLYQYNQAAENTTECLSKLKSEGYKIIATTPHRDTVMIEDLPLDNKIAIVFGTELEGITQEVIDQADGFVKIPMFGFTESYNISVAAALSLYQIKQNLEKSNIPWQLSQSQREEILCQWAERCIKMGRQLKENFIKQQQTTNESKP